ncbi:ABC transporter permease [Intrasporangium oryzae NRRL B-24470]|uniref:ABC transporter permease n=1 Tax=Intrasporangium oryzae NRRL B-24470 TaxID=1386089 RepID=W9GAA6_9MICO|nr:EamA family transporter [Intrasporangium oryzae]EWT02162.1 ABC transporter permease [Intrasporangium oryzae NRRL B-24470]
MEDKSGSWGTIALTALPAAIWGSTYAVTQEWLPPGRPLFAAAVRALPVGLLMVLWIRRLPKGSWWWRSLVLGSLNIGLFYALLFLAAYRLPSGLGATATAVAPLVVMGVARLVLGERPARVSVVAGLVGLFGVALLVLRNGLDRAVDPLGLAGAFGAVVLAAFGLVLTKRWSPPADVVTVTSWQLVAGGVVLLPIALVVEGGPPTLDLPAVLALVYLGLIGSGLAYVLWFRGLSLLGPTSASIVGLVNPVVGVALGVVFLGESFGPVHAVAMAVILGSVLAAQAPVRLWILARVRMPLGRHRAPAQPAPDCPA